MNMDEENKRQELARRLVEREVYYCVSSLVSTLSALVQNASYEVQRNEGISWEDDIYPLLGSTDYEEAGTQHINDCDDLDDLETMADNVGYWSDAIELTGWNEDSEYDEGDGEEPHTMGFSEWFEMMEVAGDEKPALDALRTYIIDHTSDWEEFCRENDVDTDDFRSEVYEHWIVSDWLARKLKARGYCVGEVCGLTIWGRQCTGQSMCLDHVIQQIALETYGDEA